MDFLDFEGEVVNVGFGDHWFLGIRLSIDFILVAEEGIAPTDDEAVVQDWDDDELVVFVLEILLWHHVRDQLAKQSWLGGSDWRKSNLNFFGQDQALFLQVCVYSIRHYLIKIIQIISPFSSTILMKTLHFPA